MLLSNLIIFSERTEKSQQSKAPLVCLFMKWRMLWLTHHVVYFIN